jgi:aminopeptidase-like protein
MQPDAAGIHDLVRDIYPLGRSITGDGVRATLARLARVAPLVVHEVPSGTPVLDWEVPPEWNLRGAWIEGPDGRRVVDAAACNLHVVGYSTPVQGEFSLDELQAHLHSDPARPDVVPYRTSYYSQAWGFCLTHHQREALRPGRYRVLIDATLAPGSLTYGEIVLPGSSADEFLVYTHTCHPALANDNASGMAVCAFLARWLAAAKRRLTYRIVFGPGTIGSITWLARNREVLPRITGGLVLALVGDPGPLVYKRSWSGGTLVDRAAEAFLRLERPGSRFLDFSPWGYDERQFGSPGFRLPVGRLTRSAEEGYPEYHSSADDLALVRPESLADALAAAQGIVGLIEANRPLVNLSPFGEPQLGRRGLYRSLGGAASPELQRAILWVLSLGDGQHDLVDVCRVAGLPVAVVLEAERALRRVGLLG